MSSFAHRLRLSGLLECPKYYRAEFLRDRHEGIGVMPVYLTISAPGERLPQVTLLMVLLNGWSCSCLRVGGPLHPCGRRRPVGLVKPLASGGLNRPPPPRILSPSPGKHVPGMGAAAVKRVAALPFMFSSSLSIRSHRCRYPGSGHAVVQAEASCFRNLLPKKEEENRP